MNIRGAIGSTKRRYLIDLIRKEEFGMVCLQKTNAQWLVRRVAIICGVQMKLIGWRTVQLIMQEELLLCGEEVVLI